MNACALSVFILLVVVPVIAAPAPIAHQLLELPVGEFNAQGKAWRVNEAKADYRGAAELLEAYLTKHGPDMPDYEFTLMHFHALQMFAAEGDTERALSHVSAAKFKVEPPRWPMRWNDYVDATAAFLRRDRGAFMSARSAVAAAPELGARAATLAVLDRLLAKFDQPYRIAYGFDAQSKKPSHP